MFPIRNISYLLPMCCSFWEQCINSQKTGLGCSTPLIFKYEPNPQIRKGDPRPPILSRVKVPSAMELKLGALAVLPTTHTHMETNAYKLHHDLWAPCSVSLLSQAFFHCSLAYAFPFLRSWASIDRLISKCYPRVMPLPWVEKSFNFKSVSWSWHRILLVVWKCSAWEFYC